MKGAYREVRLKQTLKWWSSVENHFRRVKLPVGTLRVRDVFTHGTCSQKLKFWRYSCTGGETERKPRRRQEE